MPANQRPTASRRISPALVSTTRKPRSGWAITRSASPSLSWPWSRVRPVQATLAKTRQPSAVGRAARTRCSTRRSATRPGRSSASAGRAGVGRWRCRACRHRMPHSLTTPGVAPRAASTVRQPSAGSAASRLICATTRAPRWRPSSARGCNCRRWGHSGRPARPRGRRREGGRSSGTHRDRGSRRSRTRSSVALGRRRRQNARIHPPPTLRRPSVGDPGRSSIRTESGARPMSPLLSRPVHDRTGMGDPAADRGRDRLNA